MNILNLCFLSLLLLVEHSSIKQYYWSIIIGYYECFPSMMSLNVRHLDGDVYSVIYAMFGQTLP